MLGGYSGDCKIPRRWKTGLRTARLLTQGGSSTSLILTEEIHMEIAEKSVFGHKPGLFLLFFTEMWERFSYYGMRALLVLFLVSEMAAGGWAWSREDALKLYALYTGLVYLTPIIGGVIADRLLGHRWAVILGAFLMTLGHASMAVETEAAFYAGLILLIVGNGFFKPNISSIVGQLYSKEIDKKDAAYTIFYMGINAGAFLGILLCGYVGEKIGWSYGFGIAGVFMCLGMIMFYLGQDILGQHGTRKKALQTNSNNNPDESDEVAPAPGVVADRLIVIAMLSFFTIFFWMAFEQAGGSMTIFAKDYTGRVLSGSYATAFFWVNTLLTIVPLAVVTYVLFRLVQATYRHIPSFKFGDRLQLHHHLDHRSLDDFQRISHEGLRNRLSRHHLPRSSRRRCSPTYRSSPDRQFLLSTTSEKKVRES